MKFWHKCVAVGAIGAVMVGSVATARSQAQNQGAAPWQVQNTAIVQQQQATATAQQATATPQNNGGGSGNAPPGSGGATGKGIFAPYQDMSLYGVPSLQAVTQSTGQKYYTLAFITGNGCRAEWGGSVPLNQTSTYLLHLDSDISSIRSQGGNIIISFGGQAGQELAQSCTNISSLQAQYQAVIDQYKVTRIDFDIEGGEQGNATTYERRNLALAALQAANPGLMISFTLPSLTTGLLNDSLGLLQNAVAHGVNFQIVNLMTMDYGAPNSNMGQGSIDAANGLYSELQKIFPAKSSSQLWSMVGITPMVGQNDSAGEIFSLGDARQVLAFAQQHGIGELAFWEVSRDNGNCAGQATATYSCSGISQDNYAFINIFKAF